MKPYYEHGGITIYHGDCREILPEVWLGSDLMLTDPPYGIGYVAKAGSGRIGKFDGETVVGDDAPFDPRFLLPFARRHVLFGANYFAHMLPPGGWLVWSKTQDNRWSMSTRSTAEVAWTNAHQHVALFNCFWAGSPLYRQVERGSQLHPTQKPVVLMRWILERQSKPGDLVIDPFMGSGPVAEAAHETNRRYIGIEIEERYCEIAARRLQQEVLPLEQPA